jgi:DNA-binding LacI/PurR family transcriptional regulator
MLRVMSAPSPPYLDLVGRIRGQLAAGRWPTVLPGERRLARLFGVAPMTAARALRHLAASGELVRRSRKRTWRAEPGFQVPGIQTVGVVLPPYIAGGAANPHYGGLIEALRLGARAGGCLRLTIADDLGGLRRPAGGWLADAVVAVSPDEDLLAAWRGLQPPVGVLVDAVDPAGRWGAVLPDNAAGGQLAVRHLVELGHRRIACIAGHPRFLAAGERLDGVRAELARCGLKLAGGRGASGDFEVEAGAAAARELLALAPRPTALICANDAMAIGARRACAALGLAVPGDVSLVGFDDQPAAALVDPPLTTIAVDRPAMAAAVWELLVGRWRGQSAAERRLEGRLTVRGSTGPACGA